MVLQIVFRKLVVLQIGIFSLINPYHPLSADHFATCSSSSHGSFDYLVHTHAMILFTLTLKEMFHSQNYLQMRSIPLANVLMWSVLMSTHGKSKWMGKMRQNGSNDYSILGL